MRSGRSVVSVRWRSAVVTPSAQRMSIRMMKSRRRVEGVVQSVLAPVGAVVGEEREAWADIRRNKITGQLSASRK
jgi:SH3-like domain-containing protein